VSKCWNWEKSSINKACAPKSSGRSQNSEAMQEDLPLLKTGKSLGGRISLSGG